MSLLTTVIFWIISVVVPPTVSQLVVPGLNMNAGTLVGLITLLFTAIFLIRALSDALILSDIVTDIIVKRLGIEEERSPRRAGRDAIYIIIVILVASALFPLLRALGNIGNTLATVTTYVALAMIIVLVYDIGRILYRTIEQKAEAVAEHLTSVVERKKK